MRERESIKNDILEEDQPFNPDPLILDRDIRIRIGNWNFYFYLFVKFLYIFLYISLNFFDLVSSREEEKEIFPSTPGIPGIAIPSKISWVEERGGGVRSTHSPL